MPENTFGEASISKELLLEFFLTFSRFEYALKATGYYKQHPVNPPDWPKAEPERSVGHFAPRYLQIHHKQGTHRLDSLPYRF